MAVAEPVALAQPEVVAELVAACPPRTAIASANGPATGPATDLLSVPTAYSTP